MRSSLILGLFLPILSLVFAAPTPLAIDDQTPSKRTVEDDSVATPEFTELLADWRQVRSKRQDIPVIHEDLADWRRISRRSASPQTPPVEAADLPPFQQDADWRRDIDLPPFQEDADWRRDISSLPPFDELADWRRSDSNPIDSIE